MNATAPLNLELPPSLPPHPIDEAWSALLPVAEALLGQALEAVAPPGARLGALIATPCQAQREASWDVRGASWRLYLQVGREGREGNCLFLWATLTRVEPTQLVADRSSRAHITLLKAIELLKQVAHDTHELAQALGGRSPWEVESG